jgi:ABC-type lipoprotein release transport system permease subunit
MAETMSSFGRILNILDYALSSLRRKLPKNCTIFLVFTLVVFLFASFQLTTRALTELAAKILVTAPDITVQQLTAGRQVGIARTGGEALRAIRGVRRVDERIWGYYFDPGSGANYTVVGLAAPLAGDPATFSTIWPGVASATMIASDQARRVVLSHRLRQHLGLGERQFFSLYRPDLSLASFEVVADFPPDSDLVTADLMLMSLASARDLFAIPPGEVTDLLVTVGNPREIENIAGKIRELLPGVRVVTKNQILKSYQVVFGWRSGFGSVCLLTALVAFTVLAWEKATGLSPEDLREMGILKVLGWQTADIILLRFFESALVAGAAFSCGYLFAWLHLLYADALLFRPLFLGWSVLRPSFPLVPSLALADLLLVASLSVFPYLCATAVPAWRAAVVRADTVL